jgi:putative transcriptional regulator
MLRDPVVEEIHAIRAAIVEECQGDFTKIFALAKKLEQQYADRLVTQPLPKQKMTDQVKPVQRSQRPRPVPTTTLNVKAIRTQTGLSQSQLATLMGISQRTLQQWETGRRHPQGPALALLTVFQNATEPAVQALIQRIY